MNKTRAQVATTDPRQIFTKARLAATEKDVDKALSLFQQSINEYLSRHMPLKAIAVAKKARRMLGPIPKASALVIQVYNRVGLLGDASEEYESAALFLRKDDIVFFHVLDREVFTGLLSIMDIVTFGKKKVILDRAEKSGDVYVLLSGACEVIRDKTRLGLIMPGDLFGEIGFFAYEQRSATIRTLEKSWLVKMPFEQMQELTERYSSLRQILEDIYSRRILKKVAEDLGDISPVPAEPRIITTINYDKGQDIPLSPEGSMSIIKHGIVEVDYNDMFLKRKEYLKPGAVISNKRIRARAGTDAVIMIASKDGTDKISN